MFDILNAIESYLKFLLFIKVGSEAISKFLYGLGEVVVWWIIKLCIHN